MVRFYWNFLKQVPLLFIESLATIEGQIAVVGFAVAFFNQEIGRRVASWQGFSRKWSLLVVVVYFGYLLLESNYQQFVELESAMAAQIQGEFQEREKEERKNEILQAQIEQLTLENAALQKSAPVLTDAQARIAAVRETFVEYARTAPDKDHFTNEAAYEWYLGAQAMFYQTVSGDSDLHIWNVSKAEPTYKDLHKSVALFRSVAANLTEKDLRDNTDDSRR